MLIIQFPYVPNVKEIISRLEWLDRIPTKEVEEDEPYTKFLIEQKAVAKQGNLYEAQGVWKKLIGQDETKKLNSFQKIISDWKICNDICDEIAQTPASYDSIQQFFSNLYHEQDIRVVISWLEYLRIVEVKEGKFCLRDNESEYDDEIVDGIYPMNSDAEINVKEDKMSVFEYLRKIDKGLIIMNPDFQRHLVWKNSQKSQFIESAILNIPIPPIYLKRVEDNNMIVVDGLQRSNALISFFRDGLELEGLNALTKLNTHSYKSMSADKNLEGYITRIEDKMLSFYILQQDIPMSIVYDIFNRINTGGTQLERQEIRNCIFIGKSTRMLSKISNNYSFCEAIDWGISPKRMKDREAALRCIAFTIIELDQFKGSIDDFLEIAMKKLNRMSDIEIEDVFNDFIAVMKLSRKIYGNANFRIPTDYTRGRINIAVMETVYYCLYKIMKRKMNIGENKLKSAFLRMLDDPDYLDSVRNSTGSKSSVFSRFHIASNYLLDQY